MLRMALRQRQRARLYMSACLVALLAFHAAFIFMAVDRSMLIPLITAVAFAVLAGGYAWPPIANRPAWDEAARLVGLSDEQARLTFLAVSVLSLLLIVNAVLALAMS